MGTRREESIIKHLEYCEEIKEKEKAWIAETEDLFSEYLKNPTDELLENLGDKVSKVEEEKIYIYSGGLNRISQLYRIVKNEYNDGKLRFIRDCDNFTELNAKYEKTSFAVRRIVLDLDEQMVCEAEEFIKSERPTRYLIKEIAGKELNYQKQETYIAMKEMYEKLGFDDLKSIGEDDD